jgi:hypothetical protein
LFRDPESTRLERAFAAASVVLALGGGVLSGGKMFYLGVATLFATLLLVQRQFALVMWGGLVAVAVFGVAPMFLREDAEVLLAMKRVLSGDADQIVGTRFRSDGYLTETIERLTTDRSLLWYGTGADLGHLIVADSLFLLPLATGGVPQLLLYVFPVLWLLFQLWRRRGENEYLPALFSLHASFLMSGIGVPVYQMGRISPLIWIVTLTYVFAPPVKETRPSAPSQPLPPRPRPLSPISRRA